MSKSKEIRRRLNRTRLVVDEEKKNEVSKALHEVFLLKECLGWRFVDEHVFMSQVPRRGGKRIRRKRAREYRVQWVMKHLRDAGARLVQV